MDDAEAMLMRASALADERGYRDKPQSELLALAEPLCEEHYGTAKLAQQIVWRMEAEKQVGKRSDTIGRGEAAAREQDTQWLEYFAVILALSKENRNSHVKAMMDKYGPGFMVGT